MSLARQAESLWRTRPDDQKFPTLDGLRSHCLERANRCTAKITNTKRINPQAIPLRPETAAIAVGAPVDQVDAAYSLVFETEAGIFDTTHWSFQQVAQASGCPVSWLRRIDPRKAAEDLDYAFSFVAKRSEHQLLVEDVPDRGDFKQLRAFTGKDFGRIWDHDVVSMIQDVADPHVWKPAANDYFTHPAGYVSDRDIFVFLVDDSNPVEVHVPGVVENRALSRGFIVTNGEVGSRKFKVMMFWMDYTCSNRLIWNPVGMVDLGIVHSSGAPERFRREAAGMLNAYANADAGEAARTFERAARIEVGRDRTTVGEWLQRHGRFTKKRTEKIIDRAAQEEGGYHTVWHLVNGITATARDINHTDLRTGVEAEAGKLLARVTDL